MRFSKRKEKKKYYVNLKVFLGNNCYFHRSLFDFSNKSTWYMSLLVFLLSYSGNFYKKNSLFLQRNVLKHHRMQNVAQFWKSNPKGISIQFIFVTSSTPPFVLTHVAYFWTFRNIIPWFQHINFHSFML